jgi:endonuclease/exonuclease/phosphatase family metal-dependent hydrolase
MRFLFASITWYLRDTIGIATLDLIPIALAPFVVAAVLPILSRFIGVRMGLWSGVIVLAAARTLNQLVDEPAVDFWAAAVATSAFVGLLPLLLSVGRATLVGGVLLGLAIDTSIKGLGLSLDLAYQPGLAPVVATAATAVAVFYLLYRTDDPGRHGVGWGSGARLLGVGPFLFVQLLVLQSQGWTSAAGGVSPEQGLLRIALLNVVALYLASRFERSRLVLLLSGIVVGGTLVAAEASAPVFNTFSILGVAAAGPLWAAMVPDPDPDNVSASGLYLVAGSVLYVVFGLAYYVPLDLDLGFTQPQARIAVGVLLVVFGVAGWLRIPVREVGVDRSAPLLAGVAVTLPLIALVNIVVSSPRPADGVDGPTRFMSYNLHSAFDTSGRMDVEAIARVIEDSGATVVGLQEVERGRLINAGTDLLILLQQRLGFEYVEFFGTADVVWGNAILSRYPLGPAERAFLPTEGTPLRRGYLAAPVSVAGIEILFITTHLQHVNDPDVHDSDPEGDLLPVHRAQIGGIVEEWEGRMPAVLVGDFNARPGWAQMNELIAAGWVDAWEEAGSGPGYTSDAVNPRYRIDWILHTPDLRALDAGVIQSLASDHYAVVSDIAIDRPG